jgi:hypothetical protein
MRFLRDGEKFAGPDELHPIAALVRMDFPSALPAKKDKPFQ